MVWDILKTIFEAGRSMYGDRRAASLTVHRAAFVPHDRVCYFLNVVNRSRTREIEITHVWFNTSPQVAALEPRRPLPKRLKPDEAWETWIDVGDLPGNLGESIYTLGRVRLSTGDVIKSKKNKTVAQQGFVPGGPA